MNINEALKVMLNYSDYDPDDIEWKKAFNNINKLQIEFNHDYIDKAWFVSLTIMLISFLSDLTFYDGKISIVFAALFAGLKNISHQNNLESKNLKLQKF